MKRWIPMLLLVASPGLAQDTAKGLTAVEGLKVGHHTIAEKPTGCTVVLTGKDGATAAVDVRGGAPGTRETDLLDPTSAPAGPGRGDAAGASRSLTPSCCRAAAPTASTPPAA
jgi:hypothetical protein